MPKRIDAQPQDNVAYGYVRVSTEEQVTHGVSLDAQRARIAAFCMLHDLALAQRGRRIELFTLPGYSPELNPDECLNNDVKGNAGRRRPENKQELVTQTRSYLRGTQCSPQVVRNYFREEHVRYAAG